MSNGEKSDTKKDLIDQNRISPNADMTTQTSQGAADQRVSDLTRAAEELAKAAASIATMTMAQISTPQCPPGHHWNPYQKKCVQTWIFPPECPPGHHWDPVREECVVDDITVREPHIPPGILEKKPSPTPGTQPHPIHYHCCCCHCCHCCRCCHCCCCC